MLNLTFLGTAAGMPTKNRNVTGLAITLANPHSQQKKVPWLLIDCGEGTQHQLLHTRLSVLQLQVICITHVHGDHCYGLPGLLASMAMQGRTAALTLIAPRAIAKLLDTLTLTTALYFPFAIEFIAIEDLQTSPSEDASVFDPVTITLEAGHQVSIEPLALSHRVPSHAYAITQQIGYSTLDHHKLRALDLPPSKLWGNLQHGYDVTLPTGQVLTSADFVHQQQDITKIIVAGDNDKPALLAKRLVGVGLWVHEATYTQVLAERIKQRNQGFDPMHSSAAQVAHVAQAAQLPNLILTHFSGRFQPFDNVMSTTPNMGHLRAEVAEHYQGQFWLANDFDCFMVEGLTVTQLSNPHPVK